MTRTTPTRTMAKVLVATSFLTLFTGSGAALAADDYPFRQARATGGTYEWFIDENGNGRFDANAEEYSSMLFAYRNCTDFVSHRLRNTNGVDFSNWYGGRRWGHARDWNDTAIALGIPVDQTAAVGAVAQWEPRYGHVAWIKSVTNNGHTITVEEYNHAGTGIYGERTLTRGQAGWPDNIIHVKDIAATTDSGGTAAATRTVDDPYIGGPAQYVTHQKGGDTSYGAANDSWLTTSIQSNRGSDTNWATWHFNDVAPGTYRVEAYIPSRYGYANATYNIDRNGGRVTSKAITQGNYSATWVPLAEVTSNAASDDIVVHSGDRSSSAYGTQIVWDAVRLVHNGAATSSTTTTTQQPADERVPSNMRRGDRMTRGQYMESGGYRLHLQRSDGSFVLYNSSGRAIWATDKPGALQVVFQGDGNIVAYDANGPLWATGTDRTGTDLFALQADGNIVAYDNGRPRWASNTDGR